MKKSVEVTLALIGVAGTAAGIFGLYQSKDNASRFDIERSQDHIERTLGNSFRVTPESRSLENRRIWAAPKGASGPESSVQDDAIESGTRQRNPIQIPPNASASTGPTVCCFLMPGFSGPVRVAYSGLPTSVSSKVLDYYFRMNFKKVSESDDSATVVQLSGRLHPDIVGAGECSNAKRVDLTLGDVFVTGISCSVSSNEQSEMDATADAVLNLQRSLTSQHR